MTQDDTKNSKSIPDRSSVKSDYPRIHPMWRFLYLVIAPLNGWKRIKNAGYQPDAFSRQLFYPLLALTAVLSFTDLYYRPDMTLTNILQCAIAVFVAFFIGYFSVFFLSGVFLPQEAREKVNTPFGKVFIMTGLSILALFYIVYELLQGLGIILVFSPIYAAYIIFTGVRFLRVSNKDMTPTRVVMIILIIGVPICIYTLLKALMPTPDVEV